MTRTKKRKNAGVGIDFRKAKRKVGQKLPQAQNTTDTSVRTRSIHVPSQLTAEESAVSKRQVTFKELITQARHYNSKVRRDAFIGLSELLTSHPDEIKAHISTLIYLVGEHICDTESSVRVANQNFMKKCVLSHLDERAISPFLSILVARISSALTNTNSGIARDGITLFSLLLKHYDTVIWKPFYPDLLTHILNLFSVSRSSIKLKSTLHSDVIQVLNALSELLTSKPEKERDTFTPVSTGSIFSNRCCLKQSSLEFSGFPSKSASGLTELLEDLTWKLKEHFLDSLLLLEDQQDVKQRQDHQLVIVGALKCLSLILKGSSNLAGSSRVIKSLEIVSNKLSVQFPWSSEAEDSTENCRTIGSFNMIASELLILAWKHNVCLKDSSAADRLNQFYYKILKGAVEDPQTYSQAVGLILEPLKDWMKLVSVSERNEMFLKIVDCCTASEARLQVQLQCLQFFLYHIKILDAESCTAAIRFVKCLPEMMWKLKKKCNENLKVCLQALHHIVRSGSSDLMKVVEEIQQQINLFIVIRQKKENASEFVAGPIVKWIEDMQLLLLDCLYYFPSSAPGLDLQALTFICQTPSFSVPFIRRLLMGLERKYEPEEKEWSQSLLKNLLLQGKSERRDLLVSEVVLLITKDVSAASQFTLVLLEDTTSPNNMTYSVDGMVYLVSKVIKLLPTTSALLPSFTDSLLSLLVSWFDQLFPRFKGQVHVLLADSVMSFSEAVLKSTPEIQKWNSIMEAHPRLLSFFILKLQRLLNSDLSEEDGLVLKILVMFTLLMENKKLTNQLVQEKETVQSVLAILRQEVLSDKDSTILLTNLIALT